MEDSSKPQKRQDKPYDLSRFRVMIVEDSTFIANLLSSALYALGVGKVIISHDMESARHSILEHNAVPSSRNIDVLIADWLLPDGDGGELINWIRSHKRDPIKFLPVVVCSAYASSKVVEKSRDAGANEAMVKPVSAQKLADRILYVIDRPRPYIQAPFFFGPDRRRKVEKFEGDDRRKTKPDEVEQIHERLE